MHDLLIRCSSIGKLMAKPKTIKEGPLSVGAKTYIRELAAQEIFGIDFEIGGKPLEKGIECEEEAIQLLNRVRGLDLKKNTERKNNGILTGECDLFDSQNRRGHDLKCSWSAATFPILPIDCSNALYDWQMRGYLMLWDAEEWEVNYALVDTPERLVSFEPMQMHFVSHIPEHMRLTSIVIHRDMEKEEEMIEKVTLARDYMKNVIQEFHNTHKQISSAHVLVAPVVALEAA